MSDITSTEKPRYEVLPWDTTHYGFNVGRISGDVASEGELGELLDQAKAANAKLVYFLRIHAFTIEAGFVHRYGGLRVGGYVRFACPLTSSVSVPDSPIKGVSLEVFKGPADEPHLLAMGVDAGWLSRFRTDPRLPPEKCDQLYGIWTTRSILREIADEVLIARIDDIPIGLVTFRVNMGVSEIGLVSISPTARGRGVGRFLLAFAHQRMTLRGATRCEVVTQTDNLGACRLYERAGYLPLQQGEHYHFLLA